MGYPSASSFKMAVPTVASLGEPGYEARVKYECASANVRLVDHASAEWTCGGYSVAL